MYVAFLCYLALASDALEATQPCITSDRSAGLFYALRFRYNRRSSPLERRQSKRSLAVLMVQAVCIHRHFFFYSKSRDAGVGDNSSTFSAP